MDVRDKREPAVASLDLGVAHVSHLWLTSVSRLRQRLFVSNIPQKA